jgi:hypothetical protein
VGLGNGRAEMSDKAGLELRLNVEASRFERALVMAIRIMQHATLFLHSTRADHINKLVSMGRLPECAKLKAAVKPP